MSAIFILAPTNAKSIHLDVGVTVIAMKEFAGPARANNWIAIGASA
jgi:hypothetical protein